MIKKLLDYANINKPVGHLPSWLLSMAMKSQWKKAQKQNLDSGLDLRYLNQDILGCDFFVDFQVADKKLQVGYEDDVDEAMRQTGQHMSTSL